MTSQEFSDKAFADVGSSAARRDGTEKLEDFEEYGDGDDDENYDDDESSRNISRVVPFEEATSRASVNVRGTSPTRGVGGVGPAVSPSPSLSTTAAAVSASLPSHNQQQQQQQLQQQLDDGAEPTDFLSPSILQKRLWALEAAENGSAQQASSPAFHHGKGNDRGTSKKAGSSNGNAKGKGMFARYLQMNTGDKAKISAGSAAGSRDDGGRPIEPSKGGGKYASGGTALSKGRSSASGREAQPTASTGASKSSPKTAASKIEVDGPDDVDQVFPFVEPNPPTNPKSPPSPPVSTAAARRTAAAAVAPTVTQKPSTPGLKETQAARAGSGTDQRAGRVGADETSNDNDDDDDDDEDSNDSDDSDDDDSDDGGSSDDGHRF